MDISFPFDVTYDPLLEALKLDDGYSAIADIEIADWNLSSDLYYVTIAHNLNSLAPAVKIFESSNLVHVHRIEVVDANTVRLWIPSDPDLRFDAKASILKT